MQRSVPIECPNSGARRYVRFGFVGRAFSRDTIRFARVGIYVAARLGRVRQVATGARRSQTRQPGLCSSHALIEMTGANALVVFQTALFAVFPSILSIYATCASDRPFRRIDDDGLSSGDIASLRIGTITMRQGECVFFAPVGRKCGSDKQHRYDWRDQQRLD